MLWETLKKISEWLNLTSNTYKKLFVNRPVNIKSSLGTLYDIYLVSIYYYIKTQHCKLN